MNEQGFAKAIRIITLPQIMVFFLILLLGDRLPPGHDIVAMVMLCALPLLSYLCWRVSPRLHEQGRRSQRKLAIYFSVAGYLLGTVYCLASGGSQTELFMYLSYVICGVLIALSSYVFHIKSSGHAAGVVDATRQRSFFSGAATPSLRHWSCSSFYGKSAPDRRCEFQRAMLLTRSVCPSYVQARHSPFSI